MKHNTNSANHSLVDNIRQAAKALHNSHLADEALESDILKTIQQQLKLADTKEAAVLVIVADRQANDHSTDTDDIAQYLDCSQLDAMSLSGALGALVKKGFLSRDDETPYPKPQYQYADDIFEAIVESREVRPKPVIEDTAYDQFRLCAEVHQLICQRKKHKITQGALFAETARLEDEHQELEFIAKVKAELSDVRHRVMVYDLCCMFASDEGDELRMQRQLSAIFGNPMDRAEEQAKLRKGTHPLIEHELASVDEHQNIRVQGHTIRLLYGEAADAYLGNIKQLDRYELVAEIAESVDDVPRRFHMGGGHKKQPSEGRKIERKNEHLPMVKTLMARIDNFFDRLVYYLVCNDRVKGESYELGELADVFPTSTYIQLRRQLKEGTHPLVKCGYIEVQSSDFAENAVLALTERGEKLFFEDDIDLFDEPLTGSDIIQPDSLVEKHLFFDHELQKQLSLLCESLKEENYQKLVKRLRDKKMPTGICALLYGLPGTGKTESVLQLARQTGRAVMQVSIDQTKSHWFGDSEKRVKGIFTRYKKLCEKSKLTPILLFNEADGVLSKRKDADSSNVAQTENAIQNIILQEMETLQGIMLASSNLPKNMDAAFERRWLFKIHFDAPTLDAKRSIWMDKMPSLTKGDATVLAESFAFSGGEIDNVVRKAEMEELLTGNAPTLESIVELCSKEKMTGGRRSIGFTC